MVLASSSSVSMPPAVTSAFGVAFGPGWGDGPVVQVGFEGGDAGVGPVGGRVEVEPALGHAGGEDGAEDVVGGVEITAREGMHRGEDLARAADRTGTFDVSMGSMTLRPGARSRWMGSPGCQ